MLRFLSLVENNLIKFLLFIFYMLSVHIILQLKLATPQTDHFKCASWCAVLHWLDLCPVDVTLHRLISMFLVLVVLRFHDLLKRMWILCLVYSFPCQGSTLKWRRPSSLRVAGSPSFQQMYFTCFRIKLYRCSGVTYLSVVVQLCLLKYI